MNPFQQLLQQAGKLGIGFKAQQFAKPIADAVTNPNTYRQLANAAEQTLGKSLPAEFRGINFGNIPARATGYINDVAQMVPGAARDIKSGAVQGMLDSIVGRSPRPTGLMQGRMPAARPLNPPAFFQQIGSPDPYAQNYELTRQLIKNTGGKTLADVAERLATPPRNAGDLFEGLGGQAQNLQRQIQSGLQAKVGQVGSIYKNLQGLGPTAFNPLRTRTPTTLLGKVGKTFNPLNPANIGGMAVGGLVSGLFSENDPNKGNAELFAGMPGLLPKIAATTILGATPAGVSDEQEANLIRQSNARSQFGKNYKVNGIEYDVKTGRAINPPANVFIPARSDSGLIPPASTGSSQSNAAGTPEQRHNVSQRAMIVDALSAPPVGLPPGANIPANTMSSDAQLYPTELAARYGQEQAYGNELLKAGTLVPRLLEAGATPGIAPENFAAWAKANPGLAVRLLGQAQGG